MSESGIPSGHPGFNAHSDVLNASPDTPEARASLVEELKSRGNAAFKSGQMDVAEVLYSKAIEHDPTIPALFGNRSMVRTNMGKFDPAAEDADKAIDLDPSWSKGYFRRGKALHGMRLYADAVVAFEKALELEPSNKVLSKEISASKKAAEAKEVEDTKFAEKLAKEKAIKAESDKAEWAAQEKAWKERPPEFTTEKKHNNDVPKKPQTKKSMGEDDEDSGLRGYKILPDGRKTSFFHHEMTDEERKLLGYGADGNLAPKQITVEEAARIEAEQAASTKESGASVWAGNTWEDRKMDKWAEEKLTALMVGCQFEVPELPGVLRLERMKDWKGTASIYVKAGRKRHVFDLAFKIEYVLECTGEEFDAPVKGEISYCDVLPDDVADDDILGEHKFTGDKPTGKAHELAVRYATKPNTGLAKIINDQLQAFLTEFNSL